MNLKTKVFLLVFALVVSMAGTLYANTDSDILAGTWSMPDDNTIPNDAYGDIFVTAGN